MGKLVRELLHTAPTTRSPGGAPTATTCAPGTGHGLVEPEGLSGTPGVRVVHFWPIRPHGRTRLLRPGRTVSTVGRQRGQPPCLRGPRRQGASSCIALWRRPWPPGSRLVFTRRDCLDCEGCGPSGCEVCGILVVPPPVGWIVNSAGHLIHRRGPRPFSSRSAPTRS